MKRLITWGSPKEYQEKARNENSNPAKLPKPRSKYCKRLKGPHQYGQWKQVISGYSNKPLTGLWERFCTKCNRKDWWSAPMLPGVRYELDADARPPGYRED